MDLYVDGVLECDEDSIIMSVAAFHKACRNSHVLPKPWKDMDCFIDALGPQSVGLRDGNNPRTPLLAAAKHYGLTLGVSARASSKEQLAARQKHCVRTTNQIEGRRVRSQPSSLMWTYWQKVFPGQIFREKRRWRMVSTGP